MSYLKQELLPIAAWVAMLVSAAIFASDFNFGIHKIYNHYAKTEKVLK